MKGKLERSLQGNTDAFRESSSPGAAAGLMVKEHEPVKLRPDEVQQDAGCSTCSLSKEAGKTSWAREKVEVGREAIHFHPEFKFREGGLFGISPRGVDV